MVETKLANANLQQLEEREDGSKKISDGGWRRIFDDLGGGGDDRGQTAWAVAVPTVHISWYRGISRYGPFLFYHFHSGGKEAEHGNTAVFSLFVFFCFLRLFDPLT